MYNKITVYYRNSIQTFDYIELIILLKMYSLTITKKCESMIRNFKF